MGFILKFILSAIITYVLAKFLPGAYIDGIGTAFILVIVLAILNAVVKPILKIIGFPITVFTLGLFLLVINALIVMIADWLLAGFKLDGFISALIFSIVLSLVTSVIDMVTDRD
ncbi:phage holin family protein [Hymenobacter sp. DG01]|uniref:phage holin family protein n=1 Tax=Hymenobacter sp. DG01 TaxID=2584940 RepID=UPI0011242D00|nr:phage holin family protein [Hymenobacter sp. DG01]